MTMTMTIAWCGPAIREATTQPLDEFKDVMWPIRQTYDPLVVYRPGTWLLREGWKLHGAISARDVPSRRR
jgi:hypothetical protein